MRVPFNLCHTIYLSLSLSSLYLQLSLSFTLSSNACTYALIYALRLPFPPYLSAFLPAAVEVRWRRPSAVGSGHGSPCTNPSCRPWYGLNAQNVHPFMRCVLVRFIPLHFLFPLLTFLKLFPFFLFCPIFYIIFLYSVNFSFSALYSFFSFSPLHFSSASHCNLPCFDPTSISLSFALFSSYFSFCYFTYSPAFVVAPFHLLINFPSLASLLSSDIHRCQVLFFSSKSCPTLLSSSLSLLPLPHFIHSFSHHLTLQPKQLQKRKRRKRRRRTKRRRKKKKLLLLLPLLVNIFHHLLSLSRVLLPHFHFLFLNSFFPNPNTSLQQQR